MRLRRRAQHCKLPARARCTQLTSLLRVSNKVYSGATRRASLEPAPTTELSSTYLPRHRNRVRSHPGLAPVNMSHRPTNIGNLGEPRPETPAQCTRKRKSSSDFSSQPGCPNTRRSRVLQKSYSDTSIKSSACFENVQSVERSSRSALDCGSSSRKSQSLSRRSLRAKSVSSTSSQSCSKKVNPLSNKYRSLAQKFGISIRTAEKFSGILTQKLRVPVVRTVTTRKEILSPIASPRHRSIMPGSVEHCTPKFKVIYKQEPSDNYTPNLVQISTQKTKNVIKYFDSINQASGKRDVVSPSVSSRTAAGLQATPSPTPMGKWSNKILSSPDEEEFESPKLYRSEKAISTTPKLSSVRTSCVSNPYSLQTRQLKAKLKSKKNTTLIGSTNKQTMKKKISFVRKYGTPNLEVRNKSFNESFNIKTKIKSENDSSELKKLVEYFSENKILEKDKPKELKSTNSLEKSHFETVKSISSNTLLDSVNSLSVNCHPILTNIKTEHEDTLSNGVPKRKKLQVFGIDSDEDNSQNNNVIIIPDSMEEKMDYKHDETNNQASKLTIDCTSTLDLETPTKLNITKKKRKKLESLTTSKVEAGKSTSLKKSKPVIKSINKLPPKKHFVIPKMNNKLDLKSSPDAKTKLSKETSKLIDNNDNASQSFESLCQDLNKMVGNENITLYKSNEVEDNSDKTEKVVLLQSNSNSQNIDRNLLSYLNNVPEQQTLTHEKNTSSVTSRVKSKLMLKTSRSLATNEEQQSPRTEVSLDNSHLSQNSTPTSSSSRDPRVNRLISPMKSLSSRDPRINRSLSPSKSTETTNDSRICKTQQNHEPERVGKMVESQELEPESLLKSIPITQMSAPKTPKRSSVLKRIGTRSVKSEDPNESDNDDQISIHINESFLETSDNESPSSSPRDRKFTSERIDIDEELSYQPDQSRRPNKQFTHNVRPAVDRDRPTTMGPPPTFNRVNRLGNKPPLQSKPILGITPFNQLGKSNAAMDKFIKMNEMQMKSDQQSFCTQQFENGGFNALRNNLDQTSMIERVNKPPPIGLSETKTSFFVNFCFKMLRTGICNYESSCKFSHNMMHLLALIKQKTLDLLRPILEFAIQHDFNFFFKQVWELILPTLQDESFIWLKKLYLMKNHSRQLIIDLLKYCLDSKLHTVESFVKRISCIISKGDSQTVFFVCAAVKSKLTDGFCWETIKDLSQKAAPPVDMIELAMIQCLKRKKNPSHINEVYNLVQNEISLAEQKKINEQLFANFCKLAQSQNASGKNVLNTMPLLSNGHSIPNGPPRNQPSSSIENQRFKTSVIKSPCDSNSFSLKNGKPNDSPLPEMKNTSTTEYAVNGIQWSTKECDIDEAQSVFRDKFYKLYYAVTGVNVGLTHKDYAFIWKILDDFSQENVEDELLRRAYYQILCKNVKKCESHIKEIIKLAVQSGNSSRRSLDLLFDVGVVALVDLANANHWIVAHNVLGSVKILEPDEPRTDFILISAEIYLAQGDPVEALYLLQKTRLIRTNRDEWLVKDSKKGHEQHRNKLVFILLQALTNVDQEKAVYLFVALLKDQYICHYPIDLPIYLDKLVLNLLYHSKLELAVDICTLVMDNDLTFQKEVYQELITSLLPVDEVLTNQLFEYAIQLGFYSDIQIRTGFTTIIIDTNYSEEELYLILKRLIQQLSMNIGPVVGRLKPNQLKVVLIFEDKPNNDRLYKDDIGILVKGDKYKLTKNNVVQLLSTRFCPPITISKRKISKGCKVISRTLVNYLKHWCLTT